VIREALRQGPRAAVAASIAGALLAVACASESAVQGATETDGGESGETGTEPAVYALADDVYTTLQRVWAPIVPTADTAAAIADGSFTIVELDRYDAMGLGVRADPGVPWLELVDLAPGFAEGADRRSVAYLWLAADPQLADEESPIRFEGTVELFDPHGHLVTQTFEANVRTAERISGLGARPFDFALLAGDLSDGSQRNELDWVFTTLAGGVIDPDSGEDDDPIPGPGNDFNDPFESAGLSAPWYAVPGNHDSLYMGGFGQITAEISEAALGDRVYEFGLFTNGFRDGSTPNAEVRTGGRTPADARRELFDMIGFTQALHEAPGEPAGHGLTPADADAGVAYFSLHPIEGRPLRLIALDTVNSVESGLGTGQLGYLDAEQFAWMQAELADASAREELVIVLSHHRAEDIAGISEIDGDVLAGALSAAPGVIVHLVGHGHRNERRLKDPGTATGERGYWELMMASTVDFPMQSRIVEIVDERNGYASIYVTNVGHNSEPDSLAHRGRALAAGARAFPNLLEPITLAEFWAENLDSQNLLLRFELPAGVAAELESHELPTQIESLETLSAFPLPD
jgi:3',5'-cyclic AMP phosphodiesterase CpdA